MKEKSLLNARGDVSITVIHKDGSATAYRSHNLITNAGIDFLANSFGTGTRLAQMTYIAVGTGTDAAANSDTALKAEIKRKTAIVSYPTGSGVVTVSAAFAAGEATGALTEAGILNAATGGTLFDRIVFPVINKGASDTVNFTFEITLSRG